MARKGSPKEGCGRRAGRCGPERTQTLDAFATVEHPAGINWTGKTRKA